MESQNGARWSGCGSRKLKEGRSQNGQTHTSLVRGVFLVTKKRVSRGWKNEIRSRERLILGSSGSTVTPISSNH